MEITIPFIVVLFFLIGFYCVYLSQQKKMKIKPPQLYTEGKDEIKELKFIPEQPKTDLSSLEFGHPQIVESLKTIISSVPNTFNNLYSRTRIRSVLQYWINRFMGIRKKFYS